MRKCIFIGISLAAVPAVLNAAPAGSVPQVSPSPLSTATVDAEIDPALASKLHGPQPLDGPGNWISTADYPAQALRQGHEGTTRFSLVIDAEGRPTDCLITVSSGFAELDSTTCAVLIRRSRFTPALDAARKPVSGVYSNKVRWTIPVGKPPQTATIGLAYWVEPNGTVTDCKVELTGDASQLGPLGSGFCPRRFQPYLDAQGRPVRKRVTVMMSVKVDPAPEPSTPTP